MPLVSMTILIGMIWFVTRQISLPEPEPPASADANIAAVEVQWARLVPCADGCALHTHITLHGQLFSTNIPLGSSQVMHASAMLYNAVAAISTHDADIAMYFDLQSFAQAYGTRAQGAVGIEVPYAGFGRIIAYVDTEHEYVPESVVSRLISALAAPDAAGNAQP